MTTQFATTSMKALACGMVVAAMAVVGTGHAANYTFAAAGNWSVDSNWVGGTAPWNVPSLPTDDLYLTADMTVDSSPAGFQIRRVGSTAGRTLTVPTGGTLDFSGDNDSRFLLLHNNVCTLRITGGTVRCTDTRNSPILLNGASSLLEMSGGSLLISDDVNVAGIVIQDANKSQTIHVSGSTSTFSVEGISFPATVGTGGATFMFTMDASGVSSISITEAALDLSLATNVELNLVNPGGVFAGSDALLFDLAAGSVGTFGSVVTDAGTFAGLEGTPITLGGVDYALTYDFLGGGDIGLLLAIPEPASALLLLLGLVAVRRRG